MAQKAANQIDADDWTLFDKIMYGGLGYGAFCLPTDFFKVIIAIIFPPLGELINIVENTVSSSFPYFTWDTLVILCNYNNITHLVYSLILTTLFYIPGLVYTLTNIVNKERRVSYDKESYIYKNPNIEQPSGQSDLDDIGNAAKKIGSDMQSAGETVGSGIESGVDTVGDAIGSLF